MLDGGDGTDTVDYSDRTESVSVTPDDVANDGEAGEGDNVKNVESIREFGNLEIWKFGNFCFSIATSADWFGHDRCLPNDGRFVWFRSL